MKISAIIPAAGTGSRFDVHKNKLLELISGKSVLTRTLQIIDSIPNLSEIIICTSQELIPLFKLEIQKNIFKNPINLILGGNTRQESVFNGLKACSNPDLALIHDAARPLIELEVINELISTAEEKNAAIVAVPVKDTIKIADNSKKVVSTPDRRTLWAVQTPQVFNYNKILELHEKYKEKSLTDDAALFELEQLPVFIVEGSYKNIKITTKEDILIAENFLKQEI